MKFEDIPVLKIRLMRIGAKKIPFYRVVIVDERAKRTGRYIEAVGTYNPLTEPKDIKLKQDRIDYWIKQGAQPSVGFLRIIGKAPQRPPRKPKKEQVPKEDKVAEVSKAVEETAKSSESEAISEVESAPEAEPKKESASETEPVVDDSAQQPPPTENETTESVQNKK